MWKTDNCVLRLLWLQSLQKHRFGRNTRQRRLFKALFLVCMYQSAINYIGFFFPACQNTLRLPNLSLSSTSLVICFTNLPMMHCHNFHGVACLEFAMIINHAVCVLKVEHNNTGISLDHLFKNNFSAKQIVRAGLCCGVFFPWQCMLYSKHVQKTAQVFIATIFFISNCCPRKLNEFKM